MTRDGWYCVVVMAVDDLEPLEATIEVLADPETTAQLRQAEADVAAGHLTTAEEMAELMARRRQDP